MSNRIMSRLYRCLKYGFNEFLKIGHNINPQFRQSLSSSRILRISSTIATNNISAQEHNKSIDSEFENLCIDTKYEELRTNTWKSTTHHKEVLLVMPRQKWGKKQMNVNYAKHLMSETICLINTLPNMKVIDSVMISTLDVTKKQLFGSGNLELLKKRIDSNPRINGVVFSLDMLNSVQISHLESQLAVDVSHNQGLPRDISTSI